MVLDLEVDGSHHGALGSSLKSGTEEHVLFVSAHPLYSRESIPLDQYPLKGGAPGGRGNGLTSQMGDSHVCPLGAVDWRCPGVGARPVECRDEGENEVRCCQERHKSQLKGAAVAAP